MSISFKFFSVSSLLLFSRPALASQVLSYPFSSNQDSAITNDFAGHAYCAAAGCRGTDFDESHGTPVYAAISGTVTVGDGKGDQDDAAGCASSAGYGNYVKITNGSWEVIYGHMANGFMQVTNGAAVSAGQLLGYTSNSGYTCGNDVNGSAYHLHFEVEYDNIDKDPYTEGYFIIDSDGSYNYPSEASSSIPTEAFAALDAKADDLWGLGLIHDEVENMH